MQHSRKGRGKYEGLVGYVTQMQRSAPLGLPDSNLTKLQPNFHHDWVAAGQFHKAANSSFLGVHSLGAVGGA